MDLTFLGCFKIRILCANHLGTLITELRNVNSFTQSKVLELNFTPKRACKLRQFWNQNLTKLTKRIVLETKCWQLYQIRLVYTQISKKSYENLPKIDLFLPRGVFSQTFYPNWQIFLHGCIHHISDILQICLIIPIKNLKCLKNAENLNSNLKIHM